MLVLPDRLTHEQAPACLDMLLQAARAEEGAQVVLDAAELRRFDSSALAVLLGLRRACRRARKTLRVVSMPQGLQELAQLYGVADLFAPEAPARQQAEAKAAAGA